MDKFTTLEGVAAPLKMINVDADMIIPKQYLKTIKRTGLAKGLFSMLRDLGDQVIEDSSCLLPHLSERACRQRARSGLPPGRDRA